MDFCCWNDDVCKIASCEIQKIDVKKPKKDCGSDLHSKGKVVPVHSIDSCTYFHAFDIDYTKVPPCTVKNGVLHGYPIPNMPRRYYLKTLWTPNNETLNVWTHLGPGIYFLWMLYKYSQNMDVFADWPVLVTIITAFLVTWCSALAHMFHSRSSLEHCCWLLLDFFGIISYAFGSTISHFFACTETSFYSRIGYWNLAVLTFNCCVVFYFLCSTKICNSQSATTTVKFVRISGVAYGYMYGILPVLYRSMQSDWSSLAMRYHLLSVLFMTISPYFYASNKPQCYRPGTFDIIGHNHQIFHISTALMMYYDILAVYEDVTMPRGCWSRLKEQPGHPGLLDISMFAIILIVWCGGVVHYVFKHLQKFGCEEDSSHKTHACFYNDCILKGKQKIQ